MQLQRITKHTKNAELRPAWHVIDAEGERLGRLASRVANVLQGKHRANYSRHQNTGDFVIVVNASKVGVTGKKLVQKTYYRHTGYLGHLRTRSLDEMLHRFPERVIEKAVKGMLPGNRLGRDMLGRLKVYGGATHPHESQVNAGQGKPKQAPAAATRTQPRKAAASKAEAAPSEATKAEAAKAEEARIVEASVPEAQAEETRAQAVEAQAPEAEAAQAEDTKAQGAPAETAEAEQPGEDTQDAGEKK
ncbi:MAG: 50S ribosomal protein L13 [Dehalococcoidia bacterium]